MRGDSSIIYIFIATAACSSMLCVFGLFFLTFRPGRLRHDAFPAGMIHEIVVAASESHDCFCQGVCVDPEAPELSPSPATRRAASLQKEIEVYLLILHLDQLGHLDHLHLLH